MAKMWCLVVVFLFVQNVFANYNSEISEIKKCDECIRYGAKWCKQEKVVVRCSFSEKDDWCSDTEEHMTVIPQSSAGRSIHPAFVERTLYINIEDTVSFTYKGNQTKKVYAGLWNTTQNRDGVDITTLESSECTDGACTFSVEARINEHFCTSMGTVDEFIYVSVKVEGIGEEAVIKYHVPCACECTKKALSKAPQCSGNGDFTCGICYCYSGWKGDRCDKSICQDRGDVPSVCHELGCSGNGYCGPCGDCICYSDREGSQYFDPRNLCADICSQTSELEANCGPCITTDTNGTCLSPPMKSECHPRVKMVYNANLTQMRDDSNRKIWIKCNDTFDIENGETRYIEYFAMIEESIIRLMVIDGANSEERVAGAAQTKVPLILGVLGILAAVAAVGGVMLWKHLNSVPPMPFASPDYQNIDAEDCVGENPLYKPPTSTFTNPQFGKC